MSYDPKHGKDKTDVDIDVTQDMNIDFEVTKKTVDKKEVDVDIDEDRDVDVDVDVDENVHVYKKIYEDTDVDVDIKENVYVKKDVYVDEKYKTETITTDTTNINLNENVYKNIDVDVSTWNVDVHVKAGNIIQNAYVEKNSDLDVNDLDTHGLINVPPSGTLNMDDFSLDKLAIGNSFNGAGNDLQMSLDQSNDLEDNDQVHGTSAVYENHQYPNVEASLEAEHSARQTSSGDWTEKHDHKWEVEHDDKGYGHKGKYGDKDWSASGSGSGYSNGSWAHSAAVHDTLNVSLDVTAPETAFQTVTADGGRAEAGDGITDGDLTDSASENGGDGTVSGAASAAADAIAQASAFTAEVDAGSNQQANFATLNIVGGDQTNASDIEEGHGYGPYPGTGNGGHDDDHDGGYGHGGYGDGVAIRDATVIENLDDDVNDLDTYDLINVGGSLNMDDFDLNLVAIGNSFNGPGNDMQFDVNQVNDLVDNDVVTGTSVYYGGSGWNGPFQDVSAYGGNGTSGDGIGNMTGNGVGSSNGGDGTIAGSTSASGNALATAEAFTANVVVGANLQVNNFTASVVGGDSIIADDITG